MTTRNPKYRVQTFRVVLRSDIDEREWDAETLKEYLVAQSYDVESVAQLVTEFRVSHPQGKF